MEGDSKEQYNEYCYAGGLVEYVKWLNADKVCVLHIMSNNLQVDTYFISSRLE